MATDIQKYTRKKIFSFLEKEEERELGLRAQEGDEEAIERLIFSQINFVIKVARGYGKSGVPIQDLIQEGIVGLLHAVRKFNPEKGVRLSTYSMWWIRASMQDYIVKSWSLVRFSTTSAQKSLFLNLRRLTADLIDGADALSDEIVIKLADRFQTTSLEVRKLAARIKNKDLSLNSETFQRSGCTWLDVLVSPEPSAEDTLGESSESIHLTKILSKALTHLSDREQFIIRHRYLLGVKKTFSSLGRELDISKDRVRQLEIRALKTLEQILVPMLSSNRLYPK